MIIEYSRQAKNDLEEIYCYIAFNLSAPDSAAKVYTAITTDIRSLDSSPLRNPLVDDELWRAQGLRKMIVKNFIVFYTADESVVRVIRIIYGGRDIKNQLSETDF